MLTITPALTYRVAEMCYLIEYKNSDYRSLWLETRVRKTKNRKCKMLLKNSPEILSKKNQSYLCSKYRRPTRDKKDAGVAFKGGSTTSWHEAHFVSEHRKPSSLTSCEMYQVESWIEQLQVHCWCITWHISVPSVINTLELLLDQISR